MTDVLMPSLGENVAEGAVVAVLVKPGDTIQQGDILLEVETDKVNFEVPAEVAGVIGEVLVQKGAKVRPGDRVVTVSSELVAAEPVVDAPLAIEEVPDSKPASPELKPIFDEDNKSEVNHAGMTNGVHKKVDTVRIIATPLARKLARELDLEIAEIGNKINKRVSFNDVKTFARTKLQNRTTSPSTAYVATPPLPDFEKFGAVHRQEMAGIAVATSRNMVVSASTIPHAWVSEKVDITDLEASRKKHKLQVEQAGGNLTLTALIVRAVTQALKAFPLINASVDSQKNELILKDYIHIGVAVDTDRGLLVPIIRDTDKRTVTDIAMELSRLSRAARERRTRLEDLEGATFTISNLGGIGTTGIQPLVNWPQVAILGVSASELEPVWLDNQFKPRLRMPMTLGFDHRVVNGADAARFLVYLKKVLEDSFLLLL
jgi:pyruvate dehydrogenase E2 component (dihydrolipoamide acetyltransferase)